MKRSTVSERALVLAPRGRDAAIATVVLAEAGLAGHACSSLPQLVGELDAGAAFVVVTEEALATADLCPLAAWLADQEEWSDLPFVLLTSGQTGLERNPAAKRYLDILGNVTFLERPFHPTTLVSLARSALRARRRQYEARARLNELRESEARFRNMADNAPVMLWVTDQSGSYTYLSRLWYEFTGGSEQEALGHGWTGAIHAEDRHGAERVLREANASKTPFQIEYRLRRRDGAYRWAIDTAAPRFSAHGEFLGYIGSVIDIDERREMEVRLRDLNADLERQVVERAHERGKLWQVSHDLLSAIDLATARFDKVNPAWTAALGWAVDELEGRAFADHIHPDDLGASLEAFASAQAGDPVLRFETRYRTRAGDWRWLSWMAVPEGGKLYSTTRDVTAEKQRAEELKARTAERDRIWRISPDLLLVVGFDGVLRRTNPAWTSVLGYEEHELVGVRLDDFVHPDDVEHTEKALVHAARGPVPPLENRYRHKDGGYRWISWITAPPEDGLIYATGRHITAEKARQAELEAAQEQLRQAQKMEAVGQLTGGVAHDFNNLLTIIKTSSDLLRRPNLPDERRRRYVDAISETVDRGAKLTAQLLAFARRQSLKPEAFDVAARIQAITEMLATIVGARVPIVSDVSAEPCWVMADVSQFETALVNMAVNARDAMDGEGALTVTVHRAGQVPAIRGHAAKAGDFVCVGLSDTGSGIPAEKLERIFEPFYTTKEVGKGTGLGLSQVFGFVKQSGGDVLVESEVGRGTTFTLFLPRVDGEPERDLAVGDAAAAPVEAHGRGRRVLVVEDNGEVGRFSTQILQDLGYEPTLACNGSEALGLLAETNGFDVVFSDVVMPGMSGIELGEEIRRRHPGLPVVLTSGYSHVLAEEGRHGFELLKKPYSAEDLSRMLRNVTRVRRGQA
ncbi:hybrid sensor histidine kinase/response regulator [Salinarimonas rosea]|uniref:hybrid sensor histidine kinase/response regulator n=1 Tax=Salinarimonas rosea TaxID=552063 RepID=UPI000412168D|nr:PAS domain S-box protein [Salinarimonas rosea]